jgi:hypothetical protein
MSLSVLHFCNWMFRAKRRRWFSNNSTNRVPNKLLGHYFAAMVAVCLACINVPTVQVTCSHLYGAAY